jgi:hypothetical protein
MLIAIIRSRRNDEHQGVRTRLRFAAIKVDSRWARQGSNLQPTTKYGQDGFTSREAVYVCHNVE